LIDLLIDLTDRLTGLTSSGSTEQL